MSTIRARPLIASFVQIDDGTLLFAGLFERDIGPWETYETIDARPEFVELYALTDVGTLADSRPNPPATGREVLTLTPNERMADLIGRLAIEDPKTRAYVRLAESLGSPIAALHPFSRLTASPPDWRSMTLSAAEVRAMPFSWRARLAEWRGIYLIVDRSDGSRYVGAAYGEENLLARWSQHVAGARGVTSGLAARDSSHFRFSILERTSPDLDARDVIALETTWKERLATREFGLNEN